MEDLSHKLRSCLIISDDPEELKNTFIRSPDDYNLAGIQQYFQSPGDISFIKNDFLISPKLGEEYCLFIEDEYDNIARFIEESNKAEIIKNLVVCKDGNSAEKFIQLANISPILIGLDFRLTDEPDWHPLTHRIFNSIKKKWGEIPLFGISNWANQPDEKTVQLVKLVRSRKNSVLDKSQVWSALPNILRDKFEIGRLTRENYEIKKDLKNITDALHKNAFGEKLSDRSINKEFTELSKKIIGDSFKMKELKMHIELTAQDDSNIIILGETGTGKQNVAEAIHKLSHRKGQFIDLNCAAFPETLIDTELFGYEKGAFTGADTGKLEHKKGKLELAENGTLFLDEIHHLNISSQGKLLKVLEQKKFYRVGGLIEYDLKNVRIIAASKPNIEELIEKNLFLEDLYSRLFSFIPVIPPLRDRREDIPELVRFFLLEKEPLLIPTDDAIELLTKQPWRRNIRELRTFIHNLHRLCSIKRDLILDKNKVEYGLALHNKQAVKESLVSKVFSNEIMNLDLAVKKIAEPKAKEFLIEFLTSIEKCEGTNEVGLDEISKMFLNPKTKIPGIAYTTLSSNYNKYCKHFNSLMSLPELSGKLTVAIRYSKLKDLLHS
ncbi:MAG: sigma 54-interacting transcriptional regulator [Bacteroidetes bacterium]|nr:sigma 54-interacting transcriptional regulator [Bacteroidota bacterium]